MHPESRAARRVLARSAIARVEQDPRGALHLTFGALTMRVDASICAALWRTLGEALREIGALDERTAGGAGLAMRPATPGARGLP